MKKFGLVRDVIQKGRLYVGLLKAQRHKGAVPLIVNLFITGKCNASCPYCYVEIDKHPRREFTLEQWKQLIDDLYDKGTRMFSLVGGEPLTHPHIDELVDHIVKKNVFLNLTTNGFLLHKHLKAAQKANEVSISLDGDKISHEKNRGEANFDRTVQAIDLAAKHGIKVRLCTVITRHNINQIEFLIEFADKRNIFISFTPLINPPDIRKEALLELGLADQEMRQFFIKLKEAKKKSSRIINSFANLNYMVNYPLPYSDIVWKDGPQSRYYTAPCPYGRFQYLINNIGEIYPCAIMWNNGCYQPKNIFENGLDETLTWASRDLRCQCCSFGNAVDWNNVTSLPWLWYGLKMTFKQVFGKRK